MRTLDQTLKTLAYYGPSVFPERPESLELTDETLRAASDKARRGARLTKVEKDALVLLGSWRAAVRKLESADAGNLILLLGLINVCEANHRDRDGEAIRKFVLEKYNAPIPGPPAPWAHTDWGEKWADRYSQNRAVLPLGLRQMSDGEIKTAVQKDESEEENESAFP